MCIAVSMLNTLVQSEIFWQSWEKQIMFEFYFEHCRWRKNSVKFCDTNTQNNNVIKHSLSYDDAEQSLNIKKKKL